MRSSFGGMQLSKQRYIYVTKGSGTVGKYSVPDDVVGNFDISDCIDPTTGKVTIPSFVRSDLNRLSIGTQEFLHGFFIWVAEHQVVGVQIEETTPELKLAKVLNTLLDAAVTIDCNPDIIQAIRRLERQLSKET